MAFIVFKDFERKPDGKPRSDYPGWYYQGRRHLEDLEEGVKARERALEMGTVNPEIKGRFMEELKREKERLEQIKESTPKLEGEERDRTAKLAKELGVEIASTQYTRTDMMLGLADSHEEAQRMTSKRLDVKSEDEAALAKELGIKVIDGKVSRTDKERMWKISRKALGESTNTEVLRKDRDSKSHDIKRALKEQAKEIGGARRRGRPKKA